MGDWQGKGTIPVGVEKLLLAAAEDETLPDRLFTDPLQLAEELGLRLTGVERALLEHVPPEQLRNLVAGIRVPDHRRRRFLRAVAATSAVAAVGCDEDTDLRLFDAGGLRPDGDVDADVTADASLDAAGTADASPDADVTADASLDASVLEDAGGSFGIRPDEDAG